MKSKLAALLAFLILFSSGIVLMAAELQPIAFTFTGRWQPTDDPVLIDDYGLQDIQNLRKSGKHFKGISGHSIINSTSISAQPYFLNGFHFNKTFPQESHVLVLAANTTTSPAASYLYQNTTAIPNAGTFSATTVHTDASGGMGTGRFSAAPNGNMVYCNGPETLIWGGNEILPTAFITAASALTGTQSVLTNPNDFSSQVRNTQTTADQVAPINSGTGIDNYVKLMLHGNGTHGSTSIIDSATTAHNMTPNGYPYIDTSQYKFATGSIVLDGNDDGMFYGDSDDWAFGDGAFTVDFWVMFAALPAPGSEMVIFSQRSDADNRVKFYLGNVGGAHHITLRIGATYTPIDCSSFTFAVNTWYHIALVKEDVGAVDDWYVFVDGDLLRDNPYPVDYPDIPNGLTIGYEGFVGSFLNGRIDEFRISKGIARWTSDFTPPIRQYASNATNNFLVGSTRPLQGVKLYVADANNTASTLTGSYWNGVSWTALSLTDNTSSGGISLAQTGTVTFTSTANTAKQRYVNGNALYWYQFSLSAGCATIYHVTCDAPMQPIRNVWDGSFSYVTKATVYTGTKYEDYTSAVNDQAPSTTMVLSGLSTSGYALLGFTEAMQAIKFDFDAGKENRVSSTTMSGYYWNGDEWTAMPGMNDGTAVSTTSMNKNGTVSWQPPGAGVEFPTAIGDEAPLFYYKFKWAAALTSDSTDATSEDQGVEVGEIRGVPAPNPLPTYKFSEVYQNHLFLFNEYNGLKNKAIYSMEAAPDIFNGQYSGTFYFGDDNDITAAANVYNVFGNSAYDQLIVAKNSEIYRVSGESEAAWTSKRISSTVGCVAPLSMVSAAVNGLAADQNPKNVVIWQGADGFYMTEGSTVVPISDDIKVYFDPNDARAIPSSRITKTVAWYDPSIPAYKALISSGSTATYHNVELEYSLKYREWTKIIRANAAGADPLQCGFRVFDTNGVGYTYGGNNRGFLYRLEHGSTFAGTAIEQMLHTKDMILDTEAPLFRKSAIKHLRTALKKKTNGGTVSIAHYGDQVLTVSGTSNQIVPSAINMATAPYNTQSCNLGPFLYHSLKYTLSGSTVSDGMELIGLGLWAEPYTAIR